MSFCTIITSPIPSTGGNDGGNSRLPARIYVGWVESWVTSPTTLSTFPKYANILNLSFIKPNTSYVAGSLSISATGWDFTGTGTALKAAIATLKAAQPGLKVLASVGGASFWAEWSSWSSTKATNIKNIVTDFGLDGVDIDYEVGQSTLALASRIAQQKTVLANMRTVLGPTPIIQYTGFSVGCYGVAGSTWVNSSPQGSDYSTTAAEVLTWATAQSPNPIDLVAIMGYDAGPTYNELTAFTAYKHYWPTGPLVLGVEVPAEAWGGHIYTPTEVINATNYVIANGGSGMAIWAIDKVTTGSGATARSATVFSTNICNILGLAHSSSNLPIEP